MAHLVRSFFSENGQFITLPLCAEHIQQAHDYLAQAGVAALERAQQVESLQHWGAQVKRIRVLLRDEGRPEWVDRELTEHNLTEVYNQCATMERLLDALRWAEAAFPGYLVERCHPTTSSSPTKTEAADLDNDLVLIHPESGELARFEVSDVVGESDSNRKEEKDLRSLGVLRSGTDDTKFQIEWPTGRLFLVVSEELARRLRRKQSGWPTKVPHLHYVEVKDNAPTYIFEAKKGAPSQIG